MISLPKLKFKKHLSRGSGATIRPLRDWTILLLVFLLLLIIDATASFLLYRMQQVPVVPIEVARLRTLNREKLSSVVDTFQEKRATFETLWNNRPQYPSPF